MNKKVIEQKYYKPFEIDSTEKDIIQIWQQDGSESNVVLIEKELCTTVAKAIDPEYQKVIDHNKFLEVENARLTKVYQKAVNKTHGLNATNAKLVEALESILKAPDPYNERESESWIQTARNISHNALQNNKKIEG